MVKFILNFLNKSAIRHLHDNILRIIKTDFPDVCKNHKHWDFETIIPKTTQNTIYVLHSCLDNNYVNEHKKENNKFFHIHGLSILRKKDKKHIDLPVTICCNLLQIIKLDFKILIKKEFEIQNLKKDVLTAETFEIQNEDKENLLAILKDLPKDKFEMLEIEDTFEIELEEGSYYTIFDMEDGNYIAIDKKSIVYRLLHDDKKPVKKIYNNIQDFFDVYDGNKEMLEEYMI